MTGKIYKTAQGKTIDFGAIMLQNESERAVGNMNVNARGDKIDSQGNPIVTRNQQMSKHYQNQTNTAAAPVSSGTRAQKEAEEAAQKLLDEQKIEQARAERAAKRAALLNGIPVEPGADPLTGLAAALANAQQPTKDEE